MYTVNTRNIPESFIYRCEEKIAKWLIESYKIQPLSKENNQYIFSKTEHLLNITNNLPENLRK